jgi:hypothetical protein
MHFDADGDLRLELATSLDQPHSRSIKLRTDRGRASLPRLQRQHPWLRNRKAANEIHQNLWEVFMELSQKIQVFFLPFISPIRLAWPPVVNVINLTHLPLEAPPITKCRYPHRTMGVSSGKVQINTTRRGRSPRCMSRLPSHSSHLSPSHRPSTNLNLPTHLGTKPTPTSTNTYPMSRLLHLSRSLALSPPSHPCYLHRPSP